MRRILLPALLASLSGCAILPIQYQDPVSGSVATVHFKNDSNQPVKAYIFETSRACTGRRKVGDIAPFTEVVRKVPAGAEVTFQYFLDRKGTNQFCQVNLRFSPKSDGQYVFSAVDDPWVCRWSMMDVTDPQRPAPVPLEKLTRHTGWDENSSWCKE
jgi:hypothetical protein